MIVNVIFPDEGEPINADIIDIPESIMVGHNRQEERLGTPLGV